MDKKKRDKDKKEQVVDEAAQERQVADEEVQQIIKTAAALGVEVDETDVAQWLTAMAASLCCVGPAGTTPPSPLGIPSSKRAVATVLAATQTGLVVRFRASSAEQITAAAAPSLTGQIS